MGGKRPPYSVELQISFLVLTPCKKQMACLLGTKELPFTHVGTTSTSLLENWGKPLPMVSHDHFPRGKFGGVVSIRWSAIEFLWTIQFVVSVLHDRENIDKLHWIQVSDSPYQHIVAKTNGVGIVPLDHGDFRNNCHKTDLVVFAMVKHMDDTSKIVILLYVLVL